jgi:hypothetical protein
LEAVPLCFNVFIEELEVTELSYFVDYLSVKVSLKIANNCLWRDSVMVEAEGATGTGMLAEALG